MLQMEMSKLMNDWHNCTHVGYNANVHPKVYDAYHNVHVVDVLLSCSVLMCDCRFVEEMLFFFSILCP